MSGRRWEERVGAYYAWADWSDFTGWSWAVWGPGCTDEDCSGDRCESLDAAVRNASESLSIMSRMEADDA